MLQLTQNQAATIIVGPILDTSGLPYSGSLAYTDFAIIKAGGSAPVALNASATATLYGQGSYKLALTVSDTDTAGYAEILLNKASYAMQVKELLIGSISSDVVSLSLNSLLAIMLSTPRDFATQASGNGPALRFFAGLVSGSGGVWLPVYAAVDNSQWEFNYNNNTGFWGLSCMADSPPIAYTWTAAAAGYNILQTFNPNIGTGATGTITVLSEPAATMESLPPASPVAGSRDDLLTQAAAGTGGGGSGTVVVTTPVTTNMDMQITPGNAYDTTTNQPIQYLDDGTWPTLTGGSTEVRCGVASLVNPQTPLFTANATVALVTVSNTSTQQITIPLTPTQTSLLMPGQVYWYEVSARLASNSEVRTLVSGQITALPTITKSW